MCTEDDCKKEFFEILPLYYKDNFEGKVLSEAVSETFRKELIKLAQVYIRFGLLESALTAMKEQENENLSPDLSHFLDEYIGFSGIVCCLMNDFLKLLMERLNVTIS